MGSELLINKEIFELLGSCFLSSEYFDRVINARA